MSALTETFQRFLSPAGLEALNTMERQYPVKAKAWLDALVAKYGMWEIDAPLIDEVASWKPRSGEYDPRPEPEPETGVEDDGSQWEDADFVAPEEAEVVKKAPSAAQVAGRERQALGAKGARQARTSRIKETQRKAVAKTAAAGGEPNHKDGGYGANMPNLLLDLIAPMPGPVAKAYMVALRLADHEDGTFEISHRSLAQWIGSKHRSHGERVMRRLVDSGLITQRWRGGPRRGANGYRLASLAKLDFEVTKAVLAEPLTANGKASATARAHEKSDGPCA